MFSGKAARWPAHFASLPVAIGLLMTLGLSSASVYSQQDIPDYSAMSVKELRAAAADLAVEVVPVRASTPSPAPFAFANAR
jgi:hypothetical protein